jgi:hypothetical protein
LQSVFASIEGSLPETLQVGKAELFLMQNLPPRREEKEYHDSSDDHAL